jgi:hypothetical protein
MLRKNMFITLVLMTVFLLAAPMLLSAATLPETLLNQAEFDDALYAQETYVKSDIFSVSKSDYQINNEFQLWECDSQATIDNPYVESTGLSADYGPLLKSSLVFLMMCHLRL